MQPTDRDQTLAVTKIVRKAKRTDQRHAKPSTSTYVILKLCMTVPNTCVTLKVYMTVPNTSVILKLCITVPNTCVILKLRMTAPNTKNIGICNFLLLKDGCILVHEYIRNTSSSFRCVLSVSKIC